MRIADVEDRVEVCVLKSSRIRFSDIRCDDGEKGYDWYYIRIDGHVPAVGKKAKDGSFRTPYAEAHRARRNGGDAAKAAIGYEDPDMSASSSPVTRTPSSLTASVTSRPGCIPTCLSL
ncbi:hypothetical protein ACWCSH_49255, partial [Streptosporangium sp. NPDC001682]